jgi:ATP-dependent DNA helicase RecQ
MCRKFQIPRQNVVCTGFYRENLHLRVLPVRPAEKDPTLAALLSEPPAGPSIVYTIQQKTAEAVAETLSENGVKAAAYHAGLPSERREDVQNRFMAGRIDVVAATIAFGMGIDKSDIRKVIHYDLPKSIENYSQEIGRAGRDGKVSVCAVLGDLGCVPLLENFVYGDTPEKEGLRLVLEAVQRAGGGHLEVRLHELSAETDIRLLPLKTVFVYLELREILEPRFVFFEDYPFKFIREADRIAAEFDGERKKFVEAVFAHAKTARVWTLPDIDAAMAATGSDRRRIVAALDYFDEKAGSNSGPGPAWKSSRSETRALMWRPRPRGCTNCSGPGRPTRWTGSGR